MIDYLNVGKPLAARAYFILALDDVDSAIFEHAPRLGRATEIKVEHGFVIFQRGSIVAVVFIVLLKILVSVMSGSAWCMHVGRIEDNTIQRSVLIWKFLCIHALLNIAWEQIITARRNLLPKHSASKSNVCDSAASRDVERQNRGEHVGIVPKGAAEHEIVGSNAPGRLPGTRSLALDEPNSLALRGSSNGN